MKEYKDVQVEGSTYLISLKKVLSKSIVDIHGYLSCEFDAPTFKLSRVIFEDGTELGVEGEHDFPYLVQSHRENEDRPEYMGKYCPEYSDENLQKIWDSSPDNED